MSKIANIYSDAIKSHFKVLYANWEPGTPIELGDYGNMDGNLFIPMGKLKNDFPAFKKVLLQTTSDIKKDNKEFKSESGVQVNLLPKGALSVQGAVLAKATLDIKFAGKHIVYFNAIGCTNTRITNKAKLGEKLIELYNKKKWNKNYYVVTDLVEADKAIIAISNSSDSGISFEAESPLLKKINLSDASIKLDLKMEKDIGYKVPADEGLILLIGLCKIETHLFSSEKEFKPITKGLSGAISYRMTNQTNSESLNTDFEMTRPIFKKTETKLVFKQQGKD